MSWDSELKINPGPWVGDHFEDGSGSVPCPTPCKSKHPLLWPCLSHCTPGCDLFQRRWGKQEKQPVWEHHGKRLLSYVPCPELPVSQEEMFMDCFCFTLDHVWLPVQGCHGKSACVGYNYALIHDSPVCHQKFFSALPRQVRMMQQ